MTSSNKLIKVITVVLVCLTAATYLSGKIRDPDLWWHIVIGKWITSHHSLPAQDYWTSIGSGKPWIAYSWIAEVLFAWIDQTASSFGLVLAQCFLLFSILISLAYTLGIVSGRYFFGLIVALLTSSTLTEHFSLRPQAICWLLFLWLCYFTFRRSITVILILYIWANIHLSFLLGIGWLVCNPKRIRPAYTAIAVILTLLTPYGLEVWKVALATSTHPAVFQGVQEFSKASFDNNSPALFIVLVSLLIPLMTRSFFVSTFSVFIFQIIITIISCTTIKFLPFAALSLAFIIALACRAKGRDNNFSIGIEKLEMLSSRAAPALIVVCLLCIHTNLMRITETPVDPSQFPIEAVDALTLKNLRGSVLNMFGDGGYLLYRLSDKNGELKYLRPSIDGRTNLLSEELWNQYRTSIFGKDGWQLWIERVDPVAVLLPTKSPLLKLLGPAWCEAVYGKYSLLERCQ